MVLGSTVPRVPHIAHTSKKQAQQCQRPPAASLAPVQPCEVGPGAAGGHPQAYPVSLVKGGQEVALQGMHGMTY